MKTNALVVLAGLSLSIAPAASGQGPGSAGGAVPAGHPASTGSAGVGGWTTSSIGTPVPGARPDAWSRRTARAAPESDSDRPARARTATPSPTAAAGSVPAGPAVSTPSLVVTAAVRDDVASFRWEGAFRARDGRMDRADFAIRFPDGAHPSGFRASNGGRPLDGWLLPRDRASRAYEGLVAEFARPRHGDDPILVEAPAGEEARVRIAPLEGAAETAFDLVGLLPLRAGAREVRVPLRFAGIGAPESVTVLVEVETSTPLLSLYSPTHRIQVKRAGDRRALVRLVEAGAGTVEEFRLRLVAAPGPERVLVAREKSGGGWFFARRPIAASPQAAVEVLNHTAGLSQVVARLEGAGSDEAALLLLGRFDGPGAETVAVRVGDETVSASLEIPDGVEEEPAIAALWAAARADDLTRSGSDTGRRLEASRLASRHGLLVAATAYLGLEPAIVARLARSGGVPGGVALSLGDAPPLGWEFHSLASAAVPGIVEAGASERVPATAIHRSVPR